MNGHGRISDLIFTSEADDIFIAKCDVPFVRAIIVVEFDLSNVGTSSVGRLIVVSILELWVSTGTSFMAVKMSSRMSLMTLRTAVGRLSYKCPNKTR